MVGFIHGVGWLTMVASFSGDRDGVWGGDVKEGVGMKRQGQRWWATTTTMMIGGEEKKLWCITFV